MGKHCSFITTGIFSPVENMWAHIRKGGGFKNKTFNSLDEDELKLAKELKKMDKEAVKSITLFKWIKEAVW